MSCVEEKVKDKEEMLIKIKESIQEKVKIISNNINEIRKLNGDIDGIYPAVQKNSLNDGTAVCSASSYASATSDFMTTASTFATTMAGFALAKFFALSIGQTFATAEGKANATCTCSVEDSLSNLKEGEKINFIDSIKLPYKEEGIVESKGIKNHEKVLELKKLIKENIKKIEEESTQMMILQKEIYEKEKIKGYKKTRQIINGCNIECTTVSIAFSFSDIKSGTFTTAEDNSATAEAFAVGKNIALVFGFALANCECEE